MVQARDLCLRMLTVRPRTRAELRTGLLRKGFQGEVADEVLGRLDDVGLIDDAAFAEMWVHSRHTYQGLGRRALAAELRCKGVAEPLAAQAVGAVDQESEEERARQMVRKRLRAMTTIDEVVKVRRLVGMLARKGYSQGLAFQVVRDVLKEAGADSDLLEDAAEPVDDQF